jgi:hypothetical protein
MDNFFNHDVAEWISKSVSRMDDDEAEMFTLFTVYEVHKQDIENNRRTLDRHVEEIQKSILADLQPETRELVAKALDKDIPFDNKWGKPQPRDQKGKFTRITIERGKNAVKVAPVDYHKDRIRMHRRSGEDFDLSSALATSEEAGNTFSQRWTEQGDRDHSTNERTYRRVQAGAQLLSNVPNKNVQAAAALGQFAGTIGPEAEKVIGPAARRTAYRYRGTERMPDRDLEVLRNEALVTTRKRMYSDEDFRTGAAKPLTAEAKMSASEEAAARYLYNRLPKKQWATLHRESGKLPPSEGVIINANGEVVTQAVGYMEDHYLPFNLKNLKGLKGGAYVRTRSTGGLTSEDIYTGLVAGARSVTVVSRSGVFTIDFQDDLRGGRRYSDKARQMVGRYAQVLDAVQSKRVTRRGLSPDERAEIREEVENEMEGVGYKTAEIEAEIKRRETEYSTTPRLTKAELEDINRKAQEAAESYNGPKGEGTEKGVPRDLKKRVNYYRSEFMDAAMEDKSSRMYQLDAEGYSAAMEALREAFPYYIQKPTYRKLPGSETDHGYVRQNYNRPQAVKAGYFDPAIQGHTSKDGTGKFSAADLHYQNYRRAGAGSGAAVSEGGEEGPRKLTANRINVDEVRAQARVKDLRDSSVKAAADAIAIFDVDKAATPLLARYKENPDFTLFKPADIDQMISELKTVRARVLASKIRADYPTETNAYEQAMQQVERTDAQLRSRIPFTVENWNPDVVAPTPQTWSKDAQHSIGHEPEVYKRAWAQTINSAHLGREEISPDVTDARLQALQKKYSDIYSAATQLKTNPEDADGMRRMATAMANAGMTNEQIQGLETAWIERGTPALDAVIEDNKTKALGVIQLRSILVASQGKLTAEEAKPAAAVKGELVQSVSHRLTSLMNASGTPAAEKVKLRDLQIALESGDDLSIEDALDELGPNHEGLRDAIHRELRGD